MIEKKWVLKLTMNKDNFYLLILITMSDKELVKSEGERHYESFIKSVEWYRDAETNVEKLQYLIDDWYFNESDIKDKYSEYSKKFNPIEDSDILMDYEDWFEDYADEHKDDLDDWLNEHNNALDIQAYVNPQDKEDWKATICLWVGWPNIYVKVDSGLERVKYWFYWGSDKFERDCSYLFDTIESMYSIEAYTHV